MSGVSKQTLKSVGIGDHNSLIVGVIINSTNVKTFDSTRLKFNTSERGVWSFTLRDSEDDFTNVTIWGSSEFVGRICKAFPIGSVVEVINGRIVPRVADDKNENYVPWVSCAFKIIVNEGKALVQNYDAPDREEYNRFLSIPTKSIEEVQSLSSIVEDIENLRDNFVNLLVVVTFISEARDIMTRSGTALRCRSFEATDSTSIDPISLTLWENSWVDRSASWEPRRTVLFITDALVAFDNFKKKTCVTIARKTHITENPSIPEADEMKLSISYISDNSFCSDPFATPNPNTITCVMTIEEITERINKKLINKDERVSFATIVRAVITDMNVDSLDPNIFVTRCALCKKIVPDDRDSCLNLDCPCGNGSRKPMNVLSLNVKLNLKDKTGYLIGCRLTGPAAERVLGLTATELQEMPISQRENVKLKFFLEENEVRLHVIGPTASFPHALYNVLAITRLRDIDEFDDFSQDN